MLQQANRLVSSTPRSLPSQSRIHHPALGFEGVAVTAGFSIPATIVRSHTKNELTWDLSEELFPQNWKILLENCSHGPLSPMGYGLGFYFYSVLATHP